MARAFAVLLGALAVLSLPLHGAELDGRVRAGAVVGYDTNPLKVVDQGDGDGELYTDLFVDAGFDLPVGGPWGWFGDVEARTRLHGSATSDADETEAGIRTGLAWRPARRMLLRAGARVAAQRSTFTDRADGEVYRVEGTPPSDPPTLVEIPDRFSFDSRGVFARLRVKASKRVRLTLDVDRNDNEYVTDYEPTTGLDRLDNATLAIAPGVSVRVGPTVAFRVTTSWIELDYDALPALDSAGDEIPGETREYRYLAHRLVMAVEPLPGWDLRMGLGNTDRSDESAGYYDYGAVSAYASLWKRLGERSRVGVHVSGRNLDYDSATVFGDPDTELRASDVRRYSARFERRFGDALRCFAEGGSQSTDNADPLFVYDRRWIAAGVEYRH